MDKDLPNWFGSQTKAQGLRLGESYLAALIDAAEHIQRKSSRNKTDKYFVGISGAQGSGKSTFAHLLAELLKHQYGYPSMVLALDDFYLSREERLNLAETVHPLLAVRGVPGTHDIDLLEGVTRAIRAGERISMPGFNKSEDDREAARSTETNHVRIVICEGWFWGAKPQNDSELTDTVNALEAERDQKCSWRQYVNNSLSRYQEAFQTNCLIYLAVPDLKSVLTWRWQQEQGLPEGSRKMTYPEIQEFLMYFERLTLQMMQSVPDQADITLRLNEDHEFIEYL
ncbi:MAG: D-glycerate 3-kinase [Rhodothermales bacterium]|jgi:D-glycerate 3-kinase